MVTFESSLRWSYPDPLINQTSFFCLCDAVTMKMVQIQLLTALTKSAMFVFFIFKSFGETLKKNN